MSSGRSLFQAAFASQQSISPCLGLLFPFLPHLLSISSSVYLTSTFSTLFPPHLILTYISSSIFVSGIR